MTPGARPSSSASTRFQDNLPLLLSLRDFFHQRQVTAYLVGGILRDAFLHRPTLDIDIAVQGDSISLARALADKTGGSFVLLDEARTIARVVLPSEEDKLPRKQIDLTSFSGDITHDLLRRDFTIDALALSLEHASEPDPENHLINPLHGLADLAAATIRAVSDRTFQDDPARLLRAVRLVAQLGFSLEQDTSQLIKRDAHLMSTVAPERLRDELLKTLAQPQSSRVLRLMDELGLLCRLIPELEAARDVEQPPEHYWNVFYHSLETPSQVERVTTEEGRAGDRIISFAPWFPSLEAHFNEEVSDGHTRRTIIKLAGLLHDVAKPATKTIEPSGRMRFFGHDIQGAEVCDDILHCLRLSNRGINLVTTMVRHHLRPTQMNQGVDMPTPRATYRFFRDLGDAAIDTLYLNLADYLAAKGPTTEMDDWQGHCRLINHILEQGLAQGETSRKTPRLVDGHMLMSNLGLPPGAHIGRLLETIEEAYGAGEIATQEEALDLARRLMVNSQ